MGHLDASRAAGRGLTLNAPMTPQGCALLDLLAGLMPQIRAGAEQNDRDGTFPVDVFDRFRKDGVMGGTVPGELGGIGVSRLHDVAVALLAVAEADASTALALHAQFSRGLTLSYEWRHGSPQARKLAGRLLPMMAAGEAVMAGGEKDHPSAVTTLSPGPSGGWLLSGRKTLVTIAPIATHFFVIAQTRVPGEPVRLVAPVLVRGTPGLTVLDNWDGLGMRASGTTDIVLDDCYVPGGDVLIRDVIGARDDRALAGQTVSSITMLGIYAGIAQAARDATIAALSGRSAQPQAGTRTLVAEIDARLYALRATAGSALMTADAAAADLSQDPAERGRRMMLPYQCAKLIVNQLAPAIVSDCLTLIGGASYLAAHPLARLYRDVRAGGFMHPYAYVDGVDFLSGQALGLAQDNNYMSVRVARSLAAAYQSGGDVTSGEGGAT